MKKAKVATGLITLSYIRMTHVAQSELYCCASLTVIFRPRSESSDDQRPLMMTNFASPQHRITWRYNQSVRSSHGWSCNIIFFLIPLTFNHYNCCNRCTWPWTPHNNRLWWVDWWWHSRDNKSHSSMRRRGSSMCGQLITYITIFILSMWACAERKRKSMEIDGRMTEERWENFAFFFLFFIQFFLLG